MLRLAEKAFWPAPIPFPVMHVDTGHNFDEVLAFRDERVRRARPQPHRGQRAGGAGQRAGPGAGRRHPQPDPDPGAARGGREAPLRRAVRRRPAGRGEGPGQGAGVQLPRRVRPVGPAQPAARAVVALQRPDPQRRVDPGLPAVELDRAGRLALHRPGAHRAAVHLLRPRPRGGRPRRDALRRTRASAGTAGRGAVRGPGALPHRRRRQLHRRRARPTPTPWRRSSTRSASTRITERGATRGDDRASEAAMEDRKKEGYF